jgi:hypothetical protein
MLLALEEAKASRNDAARGNGARILAFGRQRRTQQLPVRTKPMCGDSIARSIDRWSAVTNLTDVRLGKESTSGESPLDVTER